MEVLLYYINKLGKKYVPWINQKLEFLLIVVVGIAVCVMLQANSKYFKCNRNKLLFDPASYGNTYY